MKGPKPAEGEESSGIFKVRKQEEKEPVIVITNHCEHPLELDLKDTYGREYPKDIPAGETQTFKVSPGDYTAVVGVTDGSDVESQEGEVKVQEFHHYEANFFVGSAFESQPFYIGD